MRSSGDERSGVFPMRLPPRSRNWIPFPNSRRQPSWASSWKQDSPSRSKPGAVSDGLRPIYWRFLRGGSSQRSHPPAFPEAVSGLRASRPWKTAGLLPYCRLPPQSPVPEKPFTQVGRVAGIRFATNRHAGGFRCGVFRPWSEQRLVPLRQELVSRLVGAR